MARTLIVDPSKCDGCRTCEAACSTATLGWCSPNASRIKIIQPQAAPFFYPLVCLQCEIPPCVSRCPTEALEKDHRTGFVKLDQEKCPGCKACIAACDIGAISMVDGQLIKCDLCGGDPVCVKFCLTGALTYADPEEVAAYKRVAMAERAMESLVAQNGGRSPAEGRDV